MIELRRSVDVLSPLFPGLILNDPSNALAQSQYRYVIHDAKYLLLSDVGLREEYSDFMPLFHLFL